ncbi:hypothetical protein BT69DRAFT_1098612 [Atractiella rhizophila]|nr:hypothetical protein BT69DRAFT_1098612 [Atractiella rhizophila]
MDSKGGPIRWMSFRSILCSILGLLRHFRTTLSLTQSSLCPPRVSHLFAKDSSIIPATSHNNSHHRSQIQRPFPKLLRRIAHSFTEGQFSTSKRTRCPPL